MKLFKLKVKANTSLLSVVQKQRSRLNWTVRIKDDVLLFVGVQQVNCMLYTILIQKEE